MIPAVAGVGASVVKLPYQWVAVGSSGLLYTSTSTTAATWTSQTSSFGTTSINGVASNGSNLYVAVGSTGKLATSPDGATWTQRTSSFGTSDIQCVAYGSDGYWVAAGADSKVAYSTDGITWTQKTTGVAAQVQSVAYGNGLWIIGDLNGAFFTATNPTGTWTSRTSTLSATTIGCGIHYAKSLNIWLAGADGGTTGALASSVDGLTWTARDSAINLAALGGGCGFTSNATVAIGISLATLNDVQTSTNGTTWTDRTPAVTTASVRAAASDDNNLFCWIGPKAQTSSDGITWTDRGTIAAGVNLGICHSSGTPSIR